MLTEPVLTHMEMTVLITLADGDGNDDKEEEEEEEEERRRRRMEE